MSALTLLVVFLPNHSVLLRVVGVMCMCFIFFIDVVLRRLMGFGSLLQCAAIVGLCGSPLPFAKLFRHTLFPFSFCIVPARLPSTCLSYLRCLYNSSYLFIMHAPFPGIRHLFSVSFTPSRVSVFSLSNCFPVLFVSLIPPFLPLELFDLIALTCVSFFFNQPNSRTHS